MLYAAFLCYYAAEMLQITNTVFMWGCPFVILKLPLALEIVPMALVFYLCGISLERPVLIRRPSAAAGHHAFGLHSNCDHTLRLV